MRQSVDHVCGGPLPRALYVFPKRNGVARHVVLQSNFRAALVVELDAVDLERRLGWLDRRTTVEADHLQLLVRTDIDELVVGVRGHTGRPPRQPVRDVGHGYGRAQVQFDQAVRWIALHAEDALRVFVPCEEERRDKTGMEFGSAAVRPEDTSHRTR